MNRAHEVGDSRSTTTVEMERVANGAACCRSNGPAAGQLSRGPAAGPPPPGVCQPKCPAVNGSPWDLIKTWLAIVLSVAMIVWAGLGVYFIKFRKAA